jgi:hypothetical protein
MAEQGGYRKPANPAAVSGPGAFSQRTDGQPGITTKQAKQYVGGGEYGTNKAFNEEVVGGAPMNAAPTMAPQAMDVPVANPTAPSLPMPTAIDAPTERPNVPITNGLPIGDGAGPEVLQYKQQQRMELDSDLKRAAQIQTFLEGSIDRGDVSYATRQLVRKLRAMNLKGGI